MSNNAIPAPASALLVFGGFTIPAGCRRIFITAELEPSNSDPRIQPTGFPDIGPVLYPDPNPDEEKNNGLICLIDGEAKVGQFLEEVCLSDKYEGKWRSELAGLPYIKLTKDGKADGEFVTATTIDGHRFASLPARAKALLGGLCLGLCLHASLRAAGLPDAAAQSNAVPAVAPSPAQPAAVSNVSLAAAMGLEALPVTNVSDTKTNLPLATATNAALVLDDKHKLAIGDRLSFRIQEDEEDPKPLFVTDSGDLEVPYIGRVPAEGKTCRQLAAEIKTALEKDYYYQATVMLAVDLMTKSHGRVYLVGALRMPGPVELPSDELFTLSKAILRSGGFTDYADRRHVNVTRKGDAGKDAPTNAPPVNTTTTNDGKETFIVDVGEIFDKGKIETDLTLESGDLIFVPDSRGRVYLTGAVRLPGPVEFPSDEVLTLSKAILRAGGFTDYADKRHVKVTRKGAAAKDAATRPATPPGAAAKDDKETFTVDVGEILDKGKIETDLTLESGDMISVPERLIRF